LSTVETEALLQAIADGDMAALEQLYRALRVPVYALALAITADRSTAEDICQEVFERVYRFAATYRPGSHPRAWVLTIARNLALDAVRQRRRAPVTDQSADSEATAGAASGGEDAVVARLELVPALLQLDVTRRQIVVLHDVAGLTHAQIAGELGLPPGTVRWHYRVALARLQASIKAGRDD
jgi:RNA polymerase sigma factor (sigma-70 family)